MMLQPYTTVAAQARDEFTERRSRFIGHIAPVTDEEEAAAFLARVREAHREARHNVYAYLLRRNSLSRFSDDGEPSGTGGRPVLDVIRGAGLTDVMVVVTRYFGGVLLGTGGLTRAYSQGAKLAVEAAVRRELHPAVTLKLKVDYPFYGTLSHILPRFEVLTDSADFGAEISMTLCCKNALLTPFLKELAERSGGGMSPKPGDEGYREFPAPARQ